MAIAFPTHEAIPTLSSKSLLFAFSTQFYNPLYLYDVCGEGGCKTKIKYLFLPKNSPRS